MGNGAAKHDPRRVSTRSSTIIVRMRKQTLLALHSSSSQYHGLRPVFMIPTVDHDNNNGVPLRQHCPCMLCYWFCFAQTVAGPAVPSAGNSATFGV